jgi:hypothetical protein
MVGRIVVRDAMDDDWWRTSLLLDDRDLPKPALASFPPLEAILDRRIIRHG